ncbi:MAG: BON domain-containing protein, partial [Thermodesulfobacteriota bacterium]
MKVKRILASTPLAALLWLAVPDAVAAAAEPVPPPDDDHAVEPDNTARNVRDREGKTRTPIDQSNEPGDLAITQHIRKTVVANDDLSTDAHNVKIITVDRVVTLRGPVESEEERAFIVATAKSAPQVARVDDQLDVQRPAGSRPPAAAPGAPAPPAAA